MVGWGRGVAVRTVSVAGASGGEGEGDWEIAGSELMSEIDTLFTAQ